MIAYRYLITPPSEPVVETADFKIQMGITGSSKDTLITALIAAATAELDPASGGWLGRALRPQVWEWRSSNFPTDWDYPYTPPDRIRPITTTYVSPNLPFPPLKSVDAVSFVDGDGVTNVMVQNTDFRVFGLGSHTGGRVEPVYNGFWPGNIRGDYEAVKIRFTAGYPRSEDNNANGIPGGIKQAIILMAKMLLDMTDHNLYLSNVTVDGVGSRQYVVSENASKLLRTVAENLVHPYRVFE